MYIWGYIYVIQKQNQKTFFYPGGNCLNYWFVSNKNVCTVMYLRQKDGQIKGCTIGHVSTSSTQVLRYAKYRQLNWIPKSWVTVNALLFFSILSLFSPQFSSLPLFFSFLPLFIVLSFFCSLLIFLCFYSLFLYFLIFYHSFLIISRRFLFMLNTGSEWL